MRKSRKRGWAPGSLAVEAVMLAPLYLLVIFTVLSLTLFVYHEAWYTAAAEEAAVSAAAKAMDGKEGMAETADSKIEAVKGQMHPGMNRLTSSYTIGKEEIQISFRGEIPWLYGTYGMQVMAEGKSRIVVPTEFIRKVRNAEKILQVGKEREE